MAAALRSVGLGGGGRGSLGEIGALDLTRLVRLEHVALLHVVEAVEENAALEALAHLADVILETPELRDGAVLDDRAVADDADLGAAAHDAGRDHAARDRAQA